MRLDDPPPGAEAQVDFLYTGRWYDPQERRHRKVYAFLMTLSHSRHCFLYPVETALFLHCAILVNSFRAMAEGVV